MLEEENHAHHKKAEPSYLGTLGGARVGREGTWGGPPWASPPLGNGGNGPGRNGTGGAPDWGPGDGIAGAGPRPDKGLVGGLFNVGLLWVEGLGGGDLLKHQIFKTFSEVTAFVCFKKQKTFFLMSPYTFFLCDSFADSARASHILRSNMQHSHRQHALRQSEINNQRGKSNGFNYQNPNKVMLNGLARPWSLKCWSVTTARKKRSYG